MNQLQGLIQKQDSLRKAAESYIDTNKKNLKLNEDEAKALKKSIADAQEYKKVVDEIVESKMKAAQQKMGVAVVKATGGQQALDEIDNRPGKFDFAAAEKKGRDSSRKALVNKNGTIKEDEAIIAANLEYNRILKETIQNGGSAEDAMAELTKTMKAYKLELTNADEVQKQFAEDIEKVYEAANQSRDNLNQGEKTALTKGINERNSAKNLVGTLTNENVTNVQQNADQIADAENQVNQVLEKREQELVEITGLMKSNASIAEQTSNTEIEKQKQVIAEAQKYVNVQDNIQKGFDRIGQGAKQILSVTTSWRAFRNVIKSTFNDIKDLDKAFGSIAMVTSYSVKDMWAQYDQYATMANKLGQSTKSVVEASALYYQQGLKTNEVMQLTEETMKLATLAGLDFKEATSQMTAALRAFHMDMSEGAHVTDVYAEVAAHAAVDVQGLSEAMSACAAIANSSGMAFETTTAMLATMTEATQEAPKNLGTAMKTILARFTELKNNVAGTADSEFDDLDYNKVDKALKSVGISIKDATGQFRNMDDVLLELSGKWKGLDRNSQRYIATIAAGSRQQSRFIALMENYERTMQLVDVAQNSAGRSSQQFAKYQDTVEYRMKQISNTWEQFKTNLLTSDFYKDTLDNFKGFLTKLNDMSAEGLATLGATWLTVGRKAINGNLNMISSGVGSIFSGKKAENKFRESHANLDGYTVYHPATGETVANQEAIDKAWEEQKAKNALKGQALGTAIATSITTGITSGLIANSTSGAIVASIGTSLIPNIMAGIQMGGVHGAILAVGTTLASGLIAGITNYIKNNAARELNKTIEQQVKNAQKALDESTSKLEQKQSEARSTQSTIKDLESIKKQYDELKNKVILTEDEQKKYTELVNNLKENYPSLISYYDEETGKIKLNNQLLEQRKKTLTELEKQQSAAALQEQFYNTGLANKKSELDIKNKYYSEIKSTLNLSSSEIEALSKSIANVNSSNIEDFKNSVIDLAEKNEESKEVLDQIHTTLEDFEASYISNQHKEDRETYQTVLEELQKNNQALDKKQQLSDAQLRIRAEKIMKQADTSYYEGSSEKGKLNSVLFDIEYGEKYNNALGMGDIVGGWSQILGGLTDWNNLSTKTKNILEEANITKEEYDKYENEDDYDRMITFLNEKFEALYKSNVYKNLANEDQSEKEKERSEALESYQEKYSKDNVEEFKNKIKELKELGITDFTLEADFPIEEVKKYDELLNKLYLNNSKTFKDLPMQVVESQGTILQSLIDKFGESGELGKIYEEFVKMIKGMGLTSDVQNTLLSFNPQDLDGMTKNEARETLMTLFQSAIDDGKIGKEAAKSTVENYLNELEKSNLGDFSILSTSALTKIEDEIKEKYNNIVSNYKTAIDTINSNITNGFIDYLDKDKIEQAIKDLNLDPSDYIYTDEKGNYQVDVKALNEDVKQQATNEEQITKEIEAQIQNGIDQLKQKEDLIQSIIDQCKGEQENYKIQKQLTKEYAKQNALRNNKTMNEIATQYDINWADDGSAQINSKVLSDLKSGLSQIQAQRMELEKSLDDKDYIQSLVNMATAAGNKINQIYGTNTKAVEDFEKEKDKAYKDWLDKLDAIKDAQKSLAKAVETVTEKQKELANVIKGTDWKSSLDGMYNYDTALDALTKKTERAKKELDKSMDEASAKRNAQIYGQGLLDQKANIQAQIQTYQKANQNWQQEYANNFKNVIAESQKKAGLKINTNFNLSDFVSYNKEFGTYGINISKIQKNQLGFQFKDWIVEYVKTLNDNNTKIEELRDKEEALDEEWLEWKKQVRDDYIDLQQKMMDVLREKYQQEIDDLQNKYDAMEEADSKYLEALQKNIDKQRKLRDQENSWRELTDKERKLSLMQRDTSRGNAAEVKSLEKEVENDRTQLLDNAVDDIIEKLQEFYDLQKESRDAEIEYRETLLEDVNLLKEVTEELKKIHTSEDLVNWWKDNVSNISQMSEEEFNREKEEWSNLITAKVNYSTSVDETITQSIETSEQKLRDVADETQQVVETTSEQITTIAETTLKEAGEEYQKAIKTAKDALQDAVDAVDKQKKALQAAIDAANEAKKAFDDIHAKYLESLSTPPKTETIYIVNGTKTTDKDHVPTLQAQAAMHKQDTTVTTENVTKREANKITQSEKETQQKVNTTWTQPKTTKTSTFYAKDGQAYTTSEWASYKDRTRANDNSAIKINIELPSNISHGVLKYDDQKKQWTYMEGLNIDTYAEAKKYIEMNAPPSMAGSAVRDAYYKKYLAFAQGGLVDYTGPAWVDGSRSRPEAFLSAEDTRRIGEAARILADLPILSQPVNKDTITNNTVGDTNIQIEVNVDQIANDYDVDEAVNRVEQKIVEAAKYAGSNVILKKR